MRKRINYRALLVAYMDHVLASEGEDFVGGYGSVTDDPRLDATLHGISDANKAKAWPNRRGSVDISALPVYDERAGTLTKRNPGDA